MRIPFHHNSRSRYLAKIIPAGRIALSMDCMVEDVKSTPEWVWSLRPNITFLSCTTYFDRYIWDSAVVVGDTLRALHYRVMAWKVSNVIPNDYCEEHSISPYWHHRTLTGTTWPRTLYEPWNAPSLKIKFLMKGTHSSTAVQKEITSAPRGCWTHPTSFQLVPNRAVFIPNFSVERSRPTCTE